jgi:integrase/recombinase XerD
LYQKLTKMATVKVMIKENKKNSRDEYPIYIRIIKDRRIKFISTGKYIKKEHWHEKTSRVKKSHPNSARLNSFIAAKLAEAEAVALELETKSRSVSSNRIKEKIMGVSSTDFFKYADMYLEAYKSKSAVGTYRTLKAIVEKLRQYRAGKPLFLDEITLTFLKDYENHLRTTLGNTSNTIHGNFKKINQILNEAIKEDMLDMQSNPFLKYKIRQEPSNRSYLTDQELKQLEEISLPEGSLMFHHRNMYIFSAYAGGVRISDLLKLKWSNFDGVRIIFTIQKTHQPLIIKLPAKSLEILAYYKQFMQNESDFIFPGLKSNIDYSDPTHLHSGISSATTLCNKSLRKIAKKLNINKTISFHTSRHTFATRALRKGMRIEYVGKIMGHSDIKETQIYTKIINAELEKAMDVFND